MRGGPSENAEKLRELINYYDPPLLISVGDEVSLNLTKGGLKPDISVVNGKTLRRDVVNVPVPTIAVSNPPGTITSGAWNVISRGIREGSAIIWVRGEEDLLTLAAIALSPSRSFVVYGQPHEGMVVVIVNEYVRKAVMKILKGD